MLTRRYFVAAAAALCSLALATPARAIVNQVDGTIVPVTARLQACLNKSPTVSGTNPAPGDGVGSIDAVRNAAVRPQTFLPNPGGATPNVVSFVDVGEGGGYENRFGWYHVGDSPFVAANRHEVYNCRAAAQCDCPCNGGPRAAAGPSVSCVTWTNANVVRIDFGCLRALPAANPARWRGTPVAFYMMTPELLAGGGDGCAPVDSTTNRVYSTDNTVNDDGDYVHFLIYESRSFARSYYFGWEDLYRGGDNDFEDLLVRADGLVPSCVPQPEVCNGRDDNCDGNIDEGLGTTTCGRGTCARTANNCAGGAPVTCVPGAPGTESCNGMDDNCNGQVDEGVTQPCTGVCGPGVQYCIGGRFETACVTTRTPSAEACNGVDDNCNGMTDEGLSRGCATACGNGTELCAGGTWGACSAPTPGSEVCNGLDDNCNGTIDDGIPARPCSSACGPGTESCMGGRFVCNAPTPRPEVCNNVDDDCDGTVDDGVPPGGTCGRAVGACMAGHFECEGGAYVCRGTTTGTPETCNNIDDDCDGEVDEGLPAGGECRTAPDGARLCDPGRLVCRSGGMVCEGGRRGSPEVCDCMDNDCNGLVDDVPDGGSPLCPGDGRCIACQCRTPCRADAEFPCSSGLICVDGFCVPPLCNGVMCPDGQICDNNMCVDPCVRVGPTCRPDQTCERGRCVENSCYIRGCPQPTQACVNGACVTDPCRGVTCGGNEYCRDGACVRACSTVRCAVGETCTDGVCRADLCASRTCAATERCEIMEGVARCIQDECINLNCPQGRRCERGACVDDACARIVCPGDPADVRCRAGQCVLRNPPPAFVRDRGIASGGGGLACAARPGSNPRGGAGALAVLALAGALAAGRRRRRGEAGGVPAAIPPVALTLALVLAGCHSEPYCFNCIDGAVVVGDASTDTRAVDVRPNDACVPTGEEACNGLDDDCDGNIDEGFDLQTDPRHCGGCDMRCALVHALPSCVEGRCAVRDCDVGWYNLDRNPANGCEYACLPTGDEVCDGRDNDCDGSVDEGIDLQSNPNHCGACGTACRFDHATGVCSMGVCQLGTCDTGFINADGSPTNGCELSCEPSGPEACDGRDNDCNGRIDEGFDLQTDAANCGACGRPCAIPNAVASCVMGACTLVRCTPGFADDPRSTGADCSLVCGDATGRVGPEICDNYDNDCNGVIDDGTLPDVGMPCGAGGATMDVGTCRRGRNVCDRGVLRCVGEVASSSEICDGLDNDCDGTADELPLPGVGAGTRCGTDVGACTFGAFACNAAGAVVCTGGTNPTTETCNGVDDDCDGQVDESVAPPAGFRCNTRGAETTGVCTSARPECAGAGGYRCVYPDTYRNLDSEALCDGLDNNCNGAVDEGCLRPGTEVRLDQGAGNSIQPMITGNGTGALGVVYLDRRSATTTADIYLARSVNSGTAWLPDARIDHNATVSDARADSVQPWLAVSGRNYYAAWSDFRLTPADTSLTRAVFNNFSANDGATWDATDVAVVSGTTDSFNVQLVADGADVTAVWESLYPDRSRHIHVAVSRNSGHSWATVARVDHAPAAAIASVPSLAMGAPGEIFIAWRDNRGGAADIYFNRSLDYGVTFLASDVRLDSDAAGTHASDAPSVAADRSGNVFVAWSDTRTGSHSDIYLRASTDRGQTFDTTDHRVDADPLEHDSRGPIALAMGGRGVAVVWLDDRLGRTSVFAQRSDDGGTTFQPSDARVQTNAPGVSNAASLTAATSGGVVFVGWSDDRDPATASPLDIYSNYSLDGGRRYQPADIRLDTATMGSDAEAPFAFSSGGVGHFVWVDRRTDGVTGDIYYRQLAP